MATNSTEELVAQLQRGCPANANVADQTMSQAAERILALCAENAKQAKKIKQLAEDCAAETEYTAELSERMRAAESLAGPPSNRATELLRELLTVGELVIEQCGTSGPEYDAVSKRNWLAWEAARKYLDAAPGPSGAPAEPLNIDDAEFGTGEHRGPDGMSLAPPMAAQNDAEDTLLCKALNNATGNIGETWLCRQAASRIESLTRARDEALAQCAELRKDAERARFDTLTDAVEICVRYRSELAGNKGTAIESQWAARACTDRIIAFRDAARAPADADGGRGKARDEILSGEGICPDCRRNKARSADDIVAGACGKWYAIRDAEAEEDCAEHRPPSPSDEGKR